MSNPSLPNMPPSSRSQVRMLKAAKKRGYDISNLSPLQYTSLAIATRTPMELLRDSKEAITSIVLTGMGFRVVPEEVSDANEAICRANQCGSFAMLPGKPPEPVCHRCNCVGKFLRAKWRDQTQACPMNLWDNTKIVPVTLGGREING
jgi:hypothetical protein